MKLTKRGIRKFRITDLLFVGLLLFASNVLADYCEDRLYDIGHIAGAIERHIPQHYVESVARNSNLDPERLAGILKMIEEAYKAKDIDEWKKSKARDCA